MQNTGIFVIFGTCDLVLCTPQNKSGIIEQHKIVQGDKDSGEKSNSNKNQVQHKSQRNYLLIWLTMCSNYNSLYTVGP